MSTQGADDLFFDTLVQGYVDKNPRFVRRDWLAQQLDEKLREPGKRFVLLTAEPGAGKSVFMAQLAHDHPDWLRYFIRRDQQKVLADVSDKSLLLRIGYQLAARRPELFSQEQLRVSVTQQIGQVANGAEVIGAEIRRLTASPFYQKILQIEQYVQSNQGKAVGLRIEELVIGEQSLTSADLLHLALILPARALMKINQKEGKEKQEKIVILIDALDEIRYHQTAANVLAWLTNCPELPENIRFVLTSRPPDVVLNNFRTKQAERVSELLIVEDDEHVKQDVESFVAKLIAERALAQALQQIEGGAAAFTKKVTDKTHGNLGYLDALARGIDQALSDKYSTRLTVLLNLKELPTDLESLYAFFLCQIKAQVYATQIVGKDSSGKTYSTNVWPAVYKPVLGGLAVAMEPLEVDLIAKLGGIAVDLEWVRAALDGLTQFLDVTDGRYRLYHATVPEFLTADKTHLNPDTTALYQDLVSRHRQIANHYKGSCPTWAATTWEDVRQAWDEYPWRNLLLHVFSGIQPGQLATELYDLAQSGYLEWKLQQVPSLELVNADLERVFDSCEREGELGRLGEVANLKLSLTGATAVVKIDRLPRLMLRAADPPDRSKLLEKFAGASRLIPNPVTRARITRALAQDAKAVGIRSPLLAQLLAEAWQNLRDAPADSARSYQMCELARAVCQLQKENLSIVENIVFQIETDVNYGAQSLAIVGAAYVAVGREADGVQLLKRSIRHAEHTNLFTLRDFLASCSQLSPPSSLALAKVALASHSSGWFVSLAAALFARAGRNEQAAGIIEPLFAQFSNAIKDKVELEKWRAKSALSLVADALVEFTDPGVIHTVMGWLLGARKELGLISGSRSDADERGRWLAAASLRAMVIHFENGLITAPDAVAAAIELLPVELGKNGCAEELERLILAMGGRAGLDLQIALREALPTIAPPESRAKLASVLISELVRRREVEQAEAMLATEGAYLSEVARENRPGAAIALAAAAIDLNRRTEADHFVDQALSSIKALRDDFDRSESLATVVKATSLVRDTALAEEILTQSAALSHSTMSTKLVAGEMDKRIPVGSDHAFVARLARTMERRLLSPMPTPSTVAAASLAAEAFFQCGETEVAKGWVQRARYLLGQSVDERSIWQAGGHLARASIRLNAEEDYRAALDIAVGFREPWGCRLLCMIAKATSQTGAPEPFLTALADGIRRMMPASGDLSLNDLESLTGLAQAVAALDRKDVVIELMESIDARLEKEVQSRADKDGTYLEEIIDAWAWMAAICSRHMLGEAAGERLDTIIHTWLPRLIATDGKRRTREFHGLGAALRHIETPAARMSHTRAAFAAIKLRPTCVYNLAYAILHALGDGPSDPELREYVLMLRSLIVTTTEEPNPGEEYEGYCLARVLCALAKVMMPFDGSAAEDLFRVAPVAVRKCRDRQERA